KSLQELQLPKVAGATILAIERGRRFSRDVLSPSALAQLQAGDILLIDLAGPGHDVEALSREFALERIPLSGAYFADRSQEIGMVEVIVPATSRLADTTVTEAAFRTQFGLTVIGLRSGDHAHEGELLNARLSVGDMLLLIGPWREIENLQARNADL